MATLTARNVTLDGVRFPAVWLRDNCHSRDCRHAQTGQKLRNTDLADHVSVANALFSGSYADPDARFSTLAVLRREVDA